MTVFCDTVLQQLWQDKLRCVPTQGFSCSPEAGSTVPLKSGRILALAVVRIGLTLDVCFVVQDARACNVSLNQLNFKVLLFINLFAFVI